MPLIESGEALMNGVITRRHVEAHDLDASLPEGLDHALEMALIADVDQQM
jgi:hypothetical protein